MKSSRSRFLLPFCLLPYIAAAQTHRAVPTDSQILGKVQTTLHDEHAFVGSTILPSVSKGVVTLTGIVRSEAEGGGAAFGAVVGALAGGGAGAGIGAASGGALGLGVNAVTRGKEIDLKPEQLLQFHTAAPLQVTIMMVDGRQITPRPFPANALQERPAGQQQPR